MVRCHHHGRQVPAAVVARGQHERSGQEELGFAVLRQLEHLEVGLDQTEIGGRTIRVGGHLAGAGIAGGILRDVPLVAVVEEGRRVGLVVAAPGDGLDVEQQLRVAQVRFEVGRDVFLVQVGERLRVGPDDRVLFAVEGVGEVELHGAVVRVDDGLHGVPHVVERLAGGLGVEVAREVGLRVGVVRGRGVAVDDVGDATVDQHRVRVGIQQEVGSDLLHALHRVAVVDDL